MAGAGRAAQSDGLAHGAEHRPRAFEVGGAPPTMMLSEPSTARFARHRTPAHRAAPRRAPARSRASFCVSTGLDELMSMTTRAGSRPSIAAIPAFEHGLPDDLAVGQHGDQRRGALGRRLRRGGRQRRRMGADEIGDRLLRDIEHAQLEAGFGEACRHRAAHHAETDESDGGGRRERGHDEAPDVRSYS